MYFVDKTVAISVGYVMHRTASRAMCFINLSPEVAAKQQCWQTIATMWRVSGSGRQGAPRSNSCLWWPPCGEWLPRRSLVPTTTSRVAVAPWRQGASGQVEGVTLNRELLTSKAPHLLGLDTDRASRQGEYQKFDKFVIDMCSENRQKI